MMKALVPTCNRPDLFARLISRLDGFEVIGFVNNTNPENILMYKNIDLPANVKLIFTDILGEPKACHVHTFRKMLTYVNDECLIIEDDVIPCVSFNDELLNRIRILKGKCQEFTLSPINQPFRNSDFYSGGTSRPVQIGGFEFIDSAWVDGNFYMTAGVLQAMKLWLSTPVKVYGVSSGIGRRNSAEIHKRSWKMFTAVPTMVEHLDHDSVMFGDHRKSVPLISRFGM